MQSRTPLASWYALAVLSASVWYAVIDRQVLMLLAQPLQADLKLSYTQIGGLHGIGAALFTAIAVVPLGWLSDRMDRRRLLAACVVVWSVAVACCGLATDYWSLLAFFAFLAAGEAGLSPIVFALIPELFSERKRITANFIFFAAALVGSGAGVALAGAVISHIEALTTWMPQAMRAREHWRLVFFVVAIPGPFLALAILMIQIKGKRTREAVASKAGTQQPRERFTAYLAANWKAVVGIFVPAGIALLGTGPIFTWLPVVLTRDYALTAGNVGTGLGAAIGVGSIAGLVISATCAKLLTPRWGGATPIRLLQIGYLCLAMLMPLYLLADSPAYIFAIAGFQMAITIGGSALIPTLVQDLAPAPLRGRLFAMSTVITTLFQVISPIAVGLLSDHVFKQEGGLLLSCIVLGTPSFVLAVTTLLLAQQHVLRTAQKAKDASQSSAASDMSLAQAGHLRP